MALVTSVKALEFSGLKRILKVLKKNREDAKAKKVLAAKANIKGAVKFLGETPVLTHGLKKKIPTFEFAKAFTTV